MTSIILKLHVVASMQQPLTDFSQEGIMITELLVQCSNAGAGLIAGHSGWRPAIDHLERSSVRCHLVRCVVAVLSPWQPMQPAAWPVAGKTPEVDAKHPVGHLRLAVSLWVECGAEAEVHPG
jgi:hypothetical protein